MAALVIYVRLHDGRYHGRGDWPPSPARLFQALVAGAGLASPLRDFERNALEWLERQPAPIIAAPCAWQSRRGVLFYMPNNDSDRIEGDPSKMAKIRTAIKVFRPHFFDPSIPFLYVWSMGEAPEDRKDARVICSLAERLYQFGRGIDMAWAWGEAIEDRELDEVVAAHHGQVFRPSQRGGGFALPTPLSGLQGAIPVYESWQERNDSLPSASPAKVPADLLPKPAVAPALRTSRFGRRRRFRAVAIGARPRAGSGATGRRGRSA